MSSDPQRITYIGETDYRNKRTKFGIKAEDRTRHMYVIGKTGTGKSTLLENMAVQDIQNGEGFAFIDPHGKTADLLLDYIPKERIDDVLYFAPFDLANPVSFNVMEDIGADKRHLVASGLMSAFKKIWVDAWSARMEYILNNTILALLEYPGSTLLGINRLLSDKAYRNEVISHVTDPGVRTFWVEEFANYTERMAAEAVPAIQNKVGQFTANPVIRNIVGQPRSTFNIREVMDQKKILIINLSKGQVGEDSANLLGSMLITKIYLAAMSRADLRENELSKLPNFYLYVDEFQSFANESFADILSEARKYKLNLTVAHQYIEQMSEEVRAAIFGNVGTMITFRVGATDAEYLEKEFAPMFTAEDLVNLGFAQVYLKLMIGGMASAPFSARTLVPIEVPHISYRDVAIARSQKQFSRPREAVEEEIMRWHQKSLGNDKSGGNGGGKKRDDNRGGRGPDRGRGGDRNDGRSQRGNNQKPEPPKRPEESARPTSSEERRPPRPPRREERTPVERETELRKVLSLERLKAEQPKRRDSANKSKEPTAEKLSDLKSALAALLEKTESGDDEKRADAPPATSNTNDNRQHPQSSGAPQQQNDQNRPPKKKKRKKSRGERAENRINAEGQQGEQKNEQKSEQKTEQTPPQQQAKQDESIPEVPEHVLKKLFEKENNQQN